MSPNNVNDLASSFVQMAKAFEDLPKVQHELDLANATIQHYADTVQSRELAILEYKATIDSLLKDKQALEVARDDAELRFLEVDEKASHTAGVLRMLKSDLESIIENEVNMTINTLDPPKPAEPTPVISEVTPIAADPVPNGSTEPAIDHGLTEPVQTVPTDTPAAPPQGQSEADPIDAMGHTGSILDAPDTNAISTESVAGTSDPALKPYAGKRYADYPGFVTYVNWIEGGGTDEMYYAGRTSNPF